MIPDPEIPLPLPDPERVYQEGGREIRVYAAAIAEGYDGQLTEFDLLQRKKRKRKRKPEPEDMSFYEEA